MFSNWEAFPLAYIGAWAPTCILLVFSVLVVATMFRVRTTKRASIYVYRYLPIGPGRHNLIKQFRAQAEFLAWAKDFEEFEESTGNDQAAIVRFSNGTVELVPAALVEFIK